MQKYVIIFLVFFGLIPTTDAQKLPAIFESTEHDFGYIYEENGAVSFDFVFKSNSDKKIVVSQAKASCGCTTPEWTKDSIPTDAKGFVRVSYNPLNRPGPFRKNVKVSYNGDTATQTLYIKGVVILKPKNPSNFLPEKIGSLRLRSRYLHLGNVKNNQTSLKEFEVLNEGKSTIKLLNFEGPSWIKISMEPADLAPKEKAILKVSYDPKPKNDLGYTEDIVELGTSDDTIPSKQLVVSAIIEEYFPPLSEEELKSAPKISFQKTEYETWKIPQGQSVSTVYPFSNMGSRDLTIKRIKTNCSCTVGEALQTTLKPGENSQIKVTFQTDEREGWEEKLITVYSNDPQNPVKVLKIRASIVK
jgi:hypothetical protein